MTELLIEAVRRHFEGLDLDGCRNPFTDEPIADDETILGWIEIYEDTFNCKVISTEEATAAVDHQLSAMIASGALGDSTADQLTAQGEY
jgi:hypothetical protein